MEEVVEDDEDMAATVKVGDSETRFDWSSDVQQSLLLPQHQVIDVFFPVQGMTRWEPAF